MIKDVISFEEALSKSTQILELKNSSETVLLNNSLGRVIASDITCIKNLPSFNNSAMDGFAFKHADCGKTLHVNSTILAGSSPKSSLKEDECYKIMTGAKIPDDADTIIPFEDCVSYNENEIVTKEIAKGNAFRVKGEEQKVGSILLKNGSKITSGTIGLLASQGINEVEVYKELNIAIFSAGDELKEPWEKANEDEIYNINSSLLIALLNEWGFKAEYKGLLPDNLEESIKEFSKMKEYDVLITSGGISEGEADYTKKALEINGLKESFHGIEVKPGKPTMMGKMQNTLIASMPGNPLACYLNTLVLLIPALNKLQCKTDFKHKTLHVKNKENFKVKKGRVEIVLGKVENSEFQAYGKKYGSGMITVLEECNAVFLSSIEGGIVQKDETVEVLIFK